MFPKQQLYECLLFLWVGKYMDES